MIDFTFQTHNKLSVNNINDVIYESSLNSFKNIIHNTYSMASQILLSSSSLINAISKNFNIHKSKLILLPNPVDENLFTLRKIPDNKPPYTIVCISLFRPEKRIDLVLESFNNLVQSGIKAKLKLIGDGPLKKEIQNQIQKQ